MTDDALTEFQRGIAAFVNRQAVAYRKHSADAVSEDIRLAVTEFGVPLSAFYDDDSLLLTETVNPVNESVQLHLGPVDLSADDVVARIGSDETLRASAWKNLSGDVSVIIRAEVDVAIRRVEAAGFTVLGVDVPDGWRGYCDQGPCAAELGHDGTCAEASGWEPVEPPCGHEAYYGGTNGNPAVCLICPPSERP